MIPEIKEMKTWDEAARWLAKHGWGLALIEEQKAEWDKANAPKPLPKTTESVKQQPTASTTKATSDPKPKTVTVSEPKISNAPKTE